MSVEIRLPENHPPLALVPLEKENRRGTRPEIKQPLPPTPLAYQPKDAALRLGIGKTTLYELIAAKKIRVVKIGVRTLIPEAELQRYLADEIKAAR